MTAHLHELHQQVQLLASVPGKERPWETAFTELILQQLADLGEVQDAVTASYTQSARRPRAAASGFAVRGDNEVLDVFLSVYDGGTQVTSLGPVDVDSEFKRLHKFLKLCAQGLHMDLEESSDAYDMAQRVQAAMREVASVRLVLLTDAMLQLPPSAMPPVQRLAVRPEVWDLQRLAGLRTSGSECAPIVADIVAMSGRPLPFLGPEGDSGDYEGYLLLMPGQVLADIYAAFGPRLLELNVRSFLQAAGKVNRGMQDTIRNQPGRFLAYNNGVSMTASRVDVTADEHGQPAIAAIHDLQIVNGGQTTASLFHALTKAKVPLTDVRVQAKLSVVKQDRLQDVVPLISRFANSQNAVKTADLSAHHPFHLRLEELSRSVWAPSVDGTATMTRWFYERARGQYMDALGRAGAPDRRRRFKQRHPVSQRFVKTDLAKFENTWAALPHTVSSGADKNFGAYMLGLQASAGALPDRDFFQLLVAKAILFRSAEQLIGALQLGGYRSQTVTYTLALIARRLGADVDLLEIWRRQRLPAALASLITALAPEVQREIIRSAGTSNVSEHAKRPACWQAVQRLPLPVGEWRISGAQPLPSTAYGRRRCIPVHADYAGHRTHAAFNPGTKAVVMVGGPLDGMSFGSPSGAASAVVRHYQPSVDPGRNGWTFWRVSASGKALQQIR